MVPEEKLTKFDNEGNIRIDNRAARRRKPPTDNKFTKANHKIKKERLKNAKTKQQRQRAIAKARKADKADYPQVS